MALVEGNKTADRRVPMGTTYSFSHNQNAGADGHLVIIIASPSIVTNSVTYGGQSMSLVRQDYLSTTYGTDWSVWELDAPPTGVNTVQVTLASTSWQGVSTVCYSFTGSNGVGNTSAGLSAVVDRTTNLTIANNSMVIGSCIGGNSTNAYIAIPQGTNRPIDWNHNINNYTWGGISPSLSSGTITIQGGSTSTNVIMAIEVEEAAAPPPTRRRIIIC